jgi:hypothetical protein
VVWVRKIFRVLHVQVQFEVFFGLLVIFVGVDCCGESFVAAKIRHVMYSLLSG